MTSFRGVSATSDARFSDKDRKLLKTLKFPKEYDLKVTLKAVNWEVMKSWIAKRVTELLGLEDEVVIGYIYEQLEGKDTIDPRMLQISLTGFLEKNTSLFVKELWVLLHSASGNASGIPQMILDEKAEELRKKKEMQDAINEKLAAEREKRRAEEREAEAAEKAEREARRKEREAAAKAEREAAAERERKERAEREAAQKRRVEEREKERAKEREGRRDRDRDRDRDRPRDRDRDRDRERDRGRERGREREHLGSERSPDKKRSRHLDSDQAMLDAPAADAAAAAAEPAQAAAVQSGDDEGKALLPPMAAVPDAEMADAPAAEDRANPVVSMEEDGRKHKKEKREKKEKKEKKEKSEKKHKHKDKRKDREEPGGEAAVEEADEKRAFEENLRRKALEQTTRS